MVRVSRSLLSFADFITGLDLSVMSEDVFNDAVMDIVGSDTVMSEPYMIKVRQQIPHFASYSRTYRISTLGTLRQNG